MTPKSHSGTHALLDKHFGKTGRLPHPITRLLRRLYDARQMADYSSDPAATEEAAERALRDAARFVAHVEQILNE